MSVALVSTDTTTLPAALLPQAKAHCRVDFDHDDVVLTDRVGWAIQQFEIETGTRVFEQSWLWSPATVDFANGAAKSPISPVASFAADIGGADVTADYRFVTNSAVHGAGSYWLVGAWQDGLGVTIDSGYVDAADIPPGIVREIMDATAFYYEHRDLLVTAGELSPLFFRQRLAGWWVPSA